jgi:hypothetical protein
MFSHDRASAVTDAVPDQASAEPPASSDKPAPKQRRNLLFSSSLRKDRGRASAVAFQDAWPQPDRAQAASDPHGDSHGRNTSAATVLKSGVVDGMAYSLYSDGSIEAQLPEGTRRFESIDRLRAYLDQQT